MSNKERDRQGIKHPDKQIYKQNDKEKDEIQTAALHEELTLILFFYQNK